MNKSLCFSTEEFSIICHAYHITELVCFKQQTTPIVEDEAMAKQYHQSLFQLCKKGYLHVTEAGFQVSEEVKSIFSTLKNCDTVITIVCKEGTVPGFCLYFSGNSDAVVMREGSRKGEYVKAELLRKEDIAEFIKNSGILMEESIGNDLINNDKEYEIVGERLQEFLQYGDLETAEILCDMPEFVSMLRVQNPVTAFRLCYIALIKQPVQDRIIVVNEKEIQVFGYSENKVMELLQKMWEEENDIS